MIKLSKETLAANTPAELSDKLSGPGGDVAIQIAGSAMPLLSELFTYLTGLIGQRKVLKKRVETLESLLRTQEEINKAFDARLDELEKK
jgi:hypothetical protein